MTVFGGEFGSDGVYRFPVRVYFEDTDFSTNVYHAAYLKFFERARTEFLRALGIHHFELIAGGQAFAIREMTISYDSPAHIDDLLEIATEMTEVGRARMVLRQTLVRDGEIICRAGVVAVLLNEKGRPVRLPARLRGLLDRD
ncbi:YbgC/FadM family acyl-CoA thioesterase [Pelagibacterium halotolerans]|uniref:4-hydroxybenzoyl-CoA thioesterase family active site protein n=1 Tax=Pelagibacterium halotolerans (strain DSM 22347 / JCM 15775 / CGMCC 1.7692 / B2) TaxID=1082931 RepID=G4R983_PELHB|nr:YbgC/FadM family acyl-CoA thioesterase [Pelagibacterium halotolerans]AEQ52463.1 4-hydroxybenzoyl-CoA thioesterase family active site protein [Pelagibacterium halotolerans B2]QJR17810.1 YbgC/FadM family acyl-CoA thioesterase [Pelagibacterium halotolerans]SEA37164.1 acyl-CoA thioester hydrolase [Pelagibacterium halotolerans]